MKKNHLLINMKNKEIIEVNGLHTLKFDGNNYSYDDLELRKKELIKEKFNLNVKINNMLK